MYASIVILALCLIPYLIWARSYPGGPSGGSALGLFYGSLGYAFMLFAGALAVKKRLRTLNIGRTQTWMRGHLWFGLLTLPLILFHGGFAWRGPLTFVLMILLFFVVASGIFGAVLQHYMPKFITAQVQRETIYE
jgi:peptidoglycan/LPS O-acetylase OafA/YrhL